MNETTLASRIEPKPSTNKPYRLRADLRKNKRMNNSMHNVHDDLIIRYKIKQTDKITKKNKESEMSAIGMSMCMAN